jgi:glycosyltransferase involved in cell wall biosynthesis
MTNDLLQLDKRGFDAKGATERTRMRILYHHRTQGEDAQGIHVHEMVKAFRGLGHEVRVLALVSVDDKTGKKKGGAKWGRIAQMSPVWLYELLGLFYNIFGYLTLRREIKSRKPDFIYERYTLNTFCGILASRWHKIPIILEVNAPLYIEHLQQNKLKFKKMTKFFERWICSESSMTIAVTKQLKKILVEHGVPAEKVTVMYNGVDPEKISPRIDGIHVKEKYGIRDKVVVGFVGWFRKWHGIENLLRLFEENNSSLAEAKLLLVGDGPAHQELYDYYTSRDLSTSVIFTGALPHDDIPSYIAAMDIAVQPKATEYACPMKIIEYMGMGKCIVAIDQANIRELISDGENGCLFNDRQEMNSIIIDLVKNAKKRELLGSSAYETLIRKQLFWSDNAEEVISQVNKLRSQ